MSSKTPLDYTPASNYDQIWQEVYGDLQDAGPVHRHMLRVIKKVLKKLDYSSVLDIGCGPANNYLLLSKGKPLSDISFAGVDISGNAIEQAKKRTTGTFWQADIQKEHTSQKWDLVYCSLVLEHLPDDEAALKNIRLMTGRYLLLTTIAGNYERYRPWDAAVGHVRNYKRGELENKLAATGFKVRKSIYWGFPFYSPLIRTLQNYSKVGTGKYSKATFLIANLLYWIYFLNSHRKGDLLIILAEA